MVLRCGRSKGLLRPVRNSFILNRLRAKAPSVPVWRNGSATDL